MKAESLLQALCAAHLSEYVEGPFLSRGGIMLIAPPGHLKTTFIRSALESYPNALLLSDVNQQQLTRLRGDIAAKRLSTLGLLDYQKIYERNPATAMHVEGTLRALVEEGYSRAGFEDSRMFQMTSRCLVVAALTPAFYTRMYNGWDESGFARRFLFCLFRLADPDRIRQAIHDWRLAPVAGQSLGLPFSKKIPYTLSVKESAWIGGLVGRQHGAELPYVLLKRMACVMVHSYEEQKRSRKEALQVIADFSQCLDPQGAELEL